MSINDYLFKYICVVSMLFKTLSHRFSNVDFELIRLSFKIKRNLLLSNKCIGFVINLRNVDMYWKRICKTFTRLLGRRKTVTLKKSWRPANVCWVVTFPLENFFTLSRWVSIVLLALLHSSLLWSLNYPLMEIKHPR